MTDDTTSFDQEDVAGRAIRYRRLNRTIAETLAESAEIHEAIPRILEAMGEGLGWQYGTYWTPDDEAEMLRCASTWCDTDLDVKELDADTRQRVVGVGEGALGAAWASGEPVWIYDIEHESGSPRPELARDAGMRSAIYVPIPTGQAERRDALIEFLQDRPTPPDAGMIEMLHTISTFVYQYIRLRNAEGHLYNLRGLDIHDNVVRGSSQPKWPSKLAIPRWPTSQLTRRWFTQSASSTSSSWTHTAFAATENLPSTNDARRSATWSRHAACGSRMQNREP